MPGVLLCCLVHQAHGGTSLTGVLPCGSTRQALEGAPWVGPCSVVPASGVRWASLPIVQLRMLACGEREAMGMLPPTHDSHYRLASLAAGLSSTGISHHSLLPHIPSIHLSAVNSSPRPGIAPRSLNSSSQPLCLPGDLCPCPGCVCLRQGLSDSHCI